MPPSSRSHRRRPKAVVLLTALVAVAAVVLPTTGASAAKPAPPPPVQIAVDGLTSSITTPATDGAPVDFVAVGAPFSLDVSFSANGSPAPLSETRDVTLQVTTSDHGFAGGAATFIIPRGALEAVLEDIVFTTPGNGVVLTVAAVAPRQETSNIDAGEFGPVDVAKDYDDIPIADGANGFTVSRNGVGTTCSLADRLTCVDLVLPADDQNGNRAFFSTGVCDDVVGSCRSGDLMQVLAQFELPETNPATFIIKCAKSLCGKGSIQRNVVNVSVEGSGLLQEAPACLNKGVLELDQDFCVDYVQARRDGAGITYLPVLMPRDARFSI